MTNQENSDWKAFLSFLFSRSTKQSFQKISLEIITASTENELPVVGLEYSLRKVLARNFAFKILMIRVFTFKIVFPNNAIFSFPTNTLALALKLD